MSYVYMHTWIDRYIFRHMNIYLQMLYTYIYIYIYLYCTHKWYRYFGCVLLNPSLRAHARDFRLWWCRVSSLPRPGKLSMLTRAPWLWLLNGHRLGMTILPSWYIRDDKLPSCVGLMNLWIIKFLDPVKKTNQDSMESIRGCFLVVMGQSTGWTWGSAFVFRCRLVPHASSCYQTCGIEETSEKEPYFSLLPKSSCGFPTYFPRTPFPIFPPNAFNISICHPWFLGWDDQWLFP